MTVRTMARAKDSARGGGDACVASGLQVTSAAPADHQAIYQFLRQVFQQPSAGEFQSQLDQPGYESRQRLLVKHDGRIVAHLRAIPRRVHVGATILPAAYLADVATLPEFRGQRCAATLLALAESRAQRHGAVFAYLRTPRVGFYAARGWIELGATPHAVASPHAVLAQCNPLLPRRTRLMRPHDPPLRLRHWRHFEQRALERLYAAHCLRACGATARDSAYWTWLIARHAFDSIYVALDGPPRTDLDQIQDAIVGYAVTARSRLVELLSDPRRPDASGALIARFCHDAIEQNRYQVRLDAPPDSSCRAFFPDASPDAAGGTDRCDAGRGDEPAIMVRALSIDRLAESLHEEFFGRLIQAGRRPPAELGFSADGVDYLLHVDEHRTWLREDSRPRRYLSGCRDDLVRLLLGALDPAAAVARGRIRASSQAALTMSGILLPKMPLWFPPLDDLTSG